METGYIKEVMNRIPGIRVSTSLISMVRRGDRKNPQLLKVIREVLKEKGEDCRCPYCGK